MVRIFLTLLLLSPLFGGLVRGNLHPEPGHFGVQGELLYLRPSVTDTPFAIALSFSSTDVNFNSLFNENRHKLGYRAEGVYAFDPFYNIHTRFTYFDSGNNARSIEGRFISPASFIGRVDTNNKFRYYALEILLGRWLFSGCDFDLELQGGLLYSNLRYDQNVVISGPIISPPQTGSVASTFWGVGPELALSCLYPFPFSFLESFAFAADVRGALLASKNAISQRSVSGTTFIFEPIRGVFPATDFRFGLNWSSLFRCAKIDLEVGYEWIFYHRVFGRSDLSFRGPYFVLGLAY